MTEFQNGTADGHNALRVEIVTKLEQYMHVMSVRAICYMEDTMFPADQAFDGNDLQATHVIAYLHGEPVGAVRIRWFQNFAKLERFAFRPRHRDLQHIKILAEYAFRHIARKGYGRVITHASPKYARLWRMTLGMKRANKNPAIYFGEEYIELYKELNVPANAITDTADVEVLFRVEGSWDVATRYEMGR